MLGKAEADVGRAALTSFGEWSTSLFKFLKDCTSQYYTHASALARAGFYTDNIIVAFQIERAILFVGSKMSLPVKP